MVLTDKLEAGKPYVRKSNSVYIGTYQEKKPMNTAVGRTQDQSPTGTPTTANIYHFTGPLNYTSTGRYAVSETDLDDVVEVPCPSGAGCNIQGGRRRGTRRTMFKKWAAQEAREMSHKGKRMTFRKWAAHELKEKSHPGNPSFRKWARQEMREKSHTRKTS